MYRKGYSHPDGSPPSDHPKESAFVNPAPHNGEGQYLLAALVTPDRVENVKLEIDRTNKETHPRARPGASPAFRYVLYRLWA